MRYSRVQVLVTAVVAVASIAVVAQQRGPTGVGATNGEWRTYGGDLRNTRYAPLDQINKDNFGKLQIAWRLNTNNFGPTPERLYSATPLMVNGTLYTTAGSSRSVLALNPGTGQILWMYRIDEGQRGDVLQLLLRGVFQRHAVHPALDRRGAAFGVQPLVVLVAHVRSLR